MMLVGLLGQYKNSIYKALAGLCINLSAGWFGAVIIIPNFKPLTTLFSYLVLISDLLYGILFLVLTVIFERKIEHGHLRHK